MFADLYLRLQIRRWDKLVERQTLALETLAQIATDQWASKSKPIRAKAEFGELDTDWLNQRYEKERELAEVGLELEDEES